MLQNTKRYFSCLALPGNPRFIAVDSTRLSKIVTAVNLYLPNPTILGEVCFPTAWMASESLGSIQSLVVSFEFGLAGILSNTHSSEK